MTELLEKRDYLNQAELPSKRFWRICAVTAIALVVIGSIPTGAWFWRSHRKEFERRSREQLKAVAILKAGQIAAWRKERMSDGAVLQHSPMLTESARRFFSDPQNPQGRRQMRDWLAAVLENPEYGRVLLLDAQLQARLALPENESWVEPTVAQLAHSVLSSNEVVLTDLHRNADPDRINLDVLIPLPGRSAEGPAEGILCVEINPFKSLYPLLQRWPVPSPTAESLLVRQDENFVLYLNDLRDRPNSALLWRLPLGEVDLPAARVIRGEVDVIEGKDYRGAKVLAALEKVPDSPWFLVAKADAREILAPLNRGGWLLIGMVAALFGAAALGVWLLRRQRETHFLRRELAAEQERQALAERIASLTRQANDIILLADPDGNILEANERAVEAYGHPLARLRQMSLRDLLPAQARPDFDRQLGKINPDTGLLLEMKHQRKNGSMFPVKSSLRMITFGGVRYCQAVIRDLSELNSQAASKTGL